MIRILIFFLLLAFGAARAQTDVELVNHDGINDSYTLAGFSAGATADCVLARICHQGPPSSDIDTATYAGNAMTAHGPNIISTSNNRFKSRNFYWCPGAATLPDSGDVVYTTTGGTNRQALCAISLTNVDTASPVGVEATSDTGSPSVTVTDHQATSLLIATGHAENGLGAAGANQTDLANCQIIDASYGDCFSSTQSGADGGDLSYAGSSGPQMMGGVATFFAAGPPPPSGVPPFVFTVEVHD